MSKTNIFVVVLESLSIIVENSILYRRIKEHQEIFLCVVKRREIAFII